MCSPPRLSLVAVVRVAEALLAQPCLELVLHAVERQARPLRDAARARRLRERPLRPVQSKSRTLTVRAHDAPIHRSHLPGRSAALRSNAPKVAEQLRNGAMATPEARRSSHRCGAEGSASLPYVHATSRNSEGEVDVDKIDSGDTAWLLASAALVMLMTPALGFFYGGLVRRKNVLSTIMHSFFILCLISVQWVLWGYSLAFGPDKFHIIGGLEWVGLNNVGFT